MRNRLQLIGQRFGRLQVLSFDNIRNKQGAHWKVICDCGNVRIVSGKSLKRGNTKSCGCFHDEQIMTHGLTRGGRITPEYELWHNAKRRARQRNLPFSIFPSEIQIPEKCPVFDVPLIRGIKKLHSNSPSLDRIIPEKGYVSGNIWVISHRANLIKSNASLWELKMLVENLEKTIIQKVINETR